MAKKRNPQDLTLRNLRALRKGLREVVGAIQALEIRVHAIEVTMRGEAPYIDPAKSSRLPDAE